MFRLLAVLCAGIYLAMLVGGVDRGQQRFGLMAQEKPARSVIVAQAKPAAPAEAAPASPALTNAAFTPDQPVMVTPAVQVAPAAPDLPDATTEVATDTMAIRYINTASVNLREGPGTDFAVLDRLARGEAVQVVETLPDGWSRIRIEGDGGEGFVATRLLAE